jgi:hypothetical protein
LEETGLKFGFGAVIFMTLVSFAAAVDLVVTKDGTSYWAEQVKKDETLVTFVCNDSGKATNIPLPRLDAIVPGVKKGQNYTEDDIRDALKIVSSTRVKHGNLLKQLKVLQNEWEAVRAASDPEMENKIAAEVEKFKSSQKNKAAYSEAILNLTMTKYKDVTGVNNSKLDDAIGTIQQEYLGTNIKQLESRAGAARISVDEFLKIKGAALPALKKDLPPDDRTKLTALLAKARATTLNQAIPDASGLVEVTKTIDNYLKSRAILLQLKSGVAETKEEIFAVEKAISGVTRSVKSVLTDYDFNNNGYPLCKKDIDTLARTKAFSSSQMVFGTPVEERCLMILDEAPEPAVAGKQIVLPVTLVFNRALPDESEYSMVIVGSHGSGMSKHYMKLITLSARNGHAGLQFPLDIAAIGQDAAPLRDNSGAYLLMYLAYRPLANEKQDNDAKWKAISLACRIPVQ